MFHNTILLHQAINSFILTLGPGLFPFRSNVNICFYFMTKIENHHSWVEHGPVKFNFDGKYPQIMLPDGSTFPICPYLVEILTAFDPDNAMSTDQIVCKINHRRKIWNTAVKEFNQTTELKSEHFKCLPASNKYRIQIRQNISTINHLIGAPLIVHTSLTDYYCLIAG